MIDPMWNITILVLIAVVVWTVYRTRRGPQGEQMWRILQEDALKYLHHCSRRGRAVSLEGLAGVLQISRDKTAELLRKMEGQDLLQVEHDTFRLTPQGEKAALHLIRAHRLWESHLAAETGYEMTEWHQRADDREHYLTVAELTQLDSRLGYPTHDPHGDPIPTAAGELPAVHTMILASLENQQTGQIVHVEDEPPEVYDQIVAEGLYPGMLVQMLAKSPTRLTVWADGDEHVLAPIIGRNITVKPLLEATSVREPAGERLSALPVGETAEVVRLSRNCRMGERRRFMDLGILPGTKITSEFISPSGDPRAFRVRNTLIALRKEQADLIQIRQPEVN